MCLRLLQNNIPGMCVCLWFCFSWCELIFPANLLDFTTFMCLHQILCKLSVLRDNLNYINFFFSQYEWIKNWKNAKSKLNSAATNSKNSVHITHKNYCTRILWSKTRGASTVPHKKYTLFNTSQRGWNWSKCERDRDEKHGHRQVENCYINLFSTHIVIPYLGLCLCFFDERFTTGFRLGPPAHPL